MRNIETVAHKWLIFFVGSISRGIVFSQDAESDSPLLFSGDIPCDPDHKTAVLIFGEEPEDYDSREKTIKSLLAVLKKAGKWMSIGPP